MCEQETPLVASIAVHRALVRVILTGKRMEGRFVEERLVLHVAAKPLDLDDYRATTYVARLLCEAVWQRDYRAGVLRYAWARDRRILAESVLLSASASDDALYARVDTIPNDLPITSVRYLTPQEVAILLVGTYGRARA